MSSGKSSTSGQSAEHREKCIVNKTRDMNTVSIALCMVVKNEVNRISDCLDSAMDAVDEIHITDTGSTDGTPKLIRQRYGIEVDHGILDPERCYTIADQANRLYEKTRCQWILTLDADERLLTPGKDLRAAVHSAEPGVSGFFGTWRNHVPGVASFDDYKLFLFRRGYRKRGLVHDNVQTDIRELGHHARWLDGLKIAHYPERNKMDFKCRRYRWRLLKAIRMEPGWLRYPWFLGYSEFLQGKHSSAWTLLDRVRHGKINRFPVESLNARMVMTAIAASRGEGKLARSLIDEVESLRDALAGDFEVAVNFGLPDWIEHARALIRAGQAERIQPRRFAC